MVVVDAEEDETSVDDSDKESDENDAYMTCFVLSEVFACWFLTKPRSLNPTGQKALALQKRIGRIVDKMAIMQKTEDGGGPEIHAKLDSELVDIQESLVTMERLLKMSQNQTVNKGVVCERS